MKAVKLTHALREFADDIQSIEKPMPEDRFACAELVRTLARIVGGKSVDDAFGAPGDWGYGTPIGEGILAMLREPLAQSQGLAWCYAQDDFPDADTTCLLAIDDDGSDEVVIGHYDGRAFRCEDRRVSGRVFAWCYAPAKPAKKEGTS